MLQGVDLLVYDIHDIGSRYYTFAATLVLCMRACAKAGIEVAVLDRPNPIGGAVEGAPLGWVIPLSSLGASFFSTYPPWGTGQGERGRPVPLPPLAYFPDVRKFIHGVSNHSWGIPTSRRRDAPTWSSSRPTATRWAVVQQESECAGMGWETRRNGRRYYYTARRQGARVVKQYLGAGEFADALAGIDDLDRQRRRLEAHARRAERDDLKALDDQVKTLGQLADTLARAALVLAGYHRHDRGEWRKRRGKEKSRRAAR